DSLLASALFRESSEVAVTCMSDAMGALGVALRASLRSFGRGLDAGWAFVQDAGSVDGGGAGNRTTATSGGPKVPAKQDVRAREQDLLGDGPDEGANIDCFRAVGASSEMETRVEAQHPLIEREPYTFTVGTQRTGKSRL